MPAMDSTSAISMCWPNPLTDLDNMAPIIDEQADAPAKYPTSGVPKVSGSFVATPSPWHIPPAAARLMSYAFQLR